MFPEDSRVLGRLPALSLYCSDPLSSPPLSQHWKREQSKAVPISVAIHAAIGSLSTATNYSLQRPSITLANQEAISRDMGDVTYVNCLSRNYLYLNLGVVAVEKIVKQESCA